MILIFILIVVLIVILIVIKLKDNYLSTKTKIWPTSFFKKTPLIIKFLPYGFPQYDNDICRIKRILYKNNKDENGNEFKFDPLREETKNMDFKKAIIKIVSERFFPIVNIPFKFVSDNFDNNKTHIRISFDPNRSSFSFVGTDCLKIPKNEATMNFGWFDVRTVIHEFGHLLGLEHEHHSPNTDISWNKDEVYKYYGKEGKDISYADIQILEKKKIEDVNTDKFDKKSIMLYYFPKNLINGKITYQNHILSPADVLHLAKLYPKPDDLNFSKLAKWYCKIYDYKGDFFNYNK